MSSFTINHINREEIQKKYVDALVGNMDFLSIKQMLRDYIDDEKRFYSDEDLKDEILSRSPLIRDEVIFSDHDAFMYLGE